MKNIIIVSKISACIALLSALAVGCAYFSKEASVQTAVSKEGGPKHAGKVAVPLFIHEKYKSAQGDKDWLDSTITDRFVTGLIQRGYDVVDRAYIRKVMRDNQIFSTDLYQEDNIQKIGLLLHVDTIVLGKLTLVEQADGNILERKMNIRGIRVMDGAVVFSMSAVDTTMYHVLTGEDLVDQIIAKMFDGNADEVVPKENAVVSATVNTRLSLDEDEHDMSFGASSSVDMVDASVADIVDEKDTDSIDTYTENEADGLFVSSEPDGANTPSK